MLDVRVAAAAADAAPARPLPAVIALHGQRLAEHVVHRVVRIVEIRAAAGAGETHERAAKLLWARRGAVEALRRRPRVDAGEFERAGHALTLQAGAAAEI
jgi:hypothetical protein